MTETLSFHWKIVTIEYYCNKPNFDRPWSLSYQFISQLVTFIFHFIFIFISRFDFVEFISNWGGISSLFYVSFISVVSDLSCASCDMSNVPDAPTDTVAPLVEDSSQAPASQLSSYVTSSSQLRPESSASWTTMAEPAQSSSAFPSSLKLRTSPWRTRSLSSLLSQNPRERPLQSWHYSAMLAAGNVSKWCPFLILLTLKRLSMMWLTLWLRINSSSWAWNSG